MKNVVNSNEKDPPIMLKIQTRKKEKLIRDENFANLKAKRTTMEVSQQSK